MAWIADAPLRWNDESVPASRWERLSRKAGVIADQDWEVRLTAWAAQRRTEAADALAAGQEDRASRGEEDAAQAERLRSFVSEVRLRLESAEHSRTWRELATTIRSLWEDLLPREGRAARGGESGNNQPGNKVAWHDPAEQYAADRVLQLLDSLAGVDDIAGAASLSSLRDVVELRLSEDLDRVGTIGHGVLVGTVRDGVGLELDLVCVLGMAEGLLPGRHADDPLLPDRVREVTDGQLRTLAERTEQEHENLLAVLAAAPPRTAEQPGRILSFPRGDLRRGGERVPSRWLLPTLASILGKQVYATTWESALADAPGDRAAAVELVASHAAGLLADAPVTDQQWRQRALATAPAETGTDIARGTGGDHVPGGVDGPLHDDVVLARAREMVRARASGTFTRFDGRVGTTVPVPGLTGSDSVVSPTALEAWFSCPHRYFVRYLLGVREVEAPEDVVDLSALDRGTLVHAVMERMVQLWLDEDAPSSYGRPWPEHVRARLDQVAREEFDAAVQRGVTGFEVLWHGQRRRIRDDLLTWLERDGERLVREGLRPYAAELSFGRDGEPPLDVDLGDGRTLRLRGSADRVDEGPDRVVVIDYKTGKAKRYESLSASGPTAGGRFLQLPLYAAAARDRLGVQKPVMAAYWFVSEPRRLEGDRLRRHPRGLGGRPRRSQGCDGRHRSRAVPAAPEEALRRVRVPRLQPGRPGRAPGGRGLRTAVRGRGARLRTGRS